MIKNIISQSYKEYNFNKHSSTPLENESSQPISLHPNIKVSIVSLHRRKNSKKLPQL